MAEDLIRYDVLAQEALRGVVKKVLSEVAQAGLPGEHHFFVTFATRYPGVRISPRLLAEYPTEMTVVLQHQFWDLSVNDSAFEVGLSFKGVPETLHVPLQRDLELRRSARRLPGEVRHDAGRVDAGCGGERAGCGTGRGERQKAPEPVEPGTADVVSLDAFRKKN